MKQENTDKEYFINRISKNNKFKYFILFMT